MDIKRIALLIPHTDITLETDLRRHLTDDFITHTQRMFLVDVSEESEKRMVDIELPKSINYLKNITDIDVAVFGCTSASIIYGKKSIHFINDLLSTNLNCRSITAYETVISEIKRNNVKTISLIRPYINDVNVIMKNNLLKEGINVGFMDGMNLVHDRDIGKVKPEIIKEFVLKNKTSIEKTDLCFISCTNFRSLDILKELNEMFNIELISSNSSIIKYLKNNFWIENKE